MLALIGKRAPGNSDKTDGFSRLFLKMNSGREHMAFYFWTERLTNQGHHLRPGNHGENNKPLPRPPASVSSLVKTDF